MGVRAGVMISEMVIDGVMVLVMGCIMVPENVGGWLQRTVTPMSLHSLALLH